MSRINPVEPPYETEVAEQLEGMMPPGVVPLLLFRTFVHNLPMTQAMGSWGGYELSRRLSLSMREREIVIDRTCARCHCEYEWGVHVATFAEKSGLSAEQITSLRHGESSDECWESDGERVLIEVVDSLHETSMIDDDLWTKLSHHFSEEQTLDVTMLTGWYHAIGFTANAVQLDLEDGVPRFDDVR